MASLRDPDFRDAARGLGPATGQDRGGPDNIATARRSEAEAARDLALERGLMFGLTKDKAFLAADRFYTAKLEAANGSGVTGTAVLALDDETGALTVAIAADGLVPDRNHIQRIHGFVDDVTEAEIPTAAHDLDGDGYLEAQEGAAVYGPGLLNLEGSEVRVGFDGPSAFPTAPNGRIFFVETYASPLADLGADPLLALRAVVVHGANVPAGAGAGTGGEVDGTGAGYRLTLPAAIGAIEPAGSGADFRDDVFGDFRQMLADVQRDLALAGRRPADGDYFLG